MTSERNTARKRVVGGLIAGLSCAVLPMSAPAQTVGNDQIKQLQDEIRKIQREYQSQIRGLQKQLDDLKAAQAAPKVPLSVKLKVRPPESVWATKIWLTA